MVVLGERLFLMGEVPLYLVSVLWSMRVAGWKALHASVVWLG